MTCLILPTRILKNVEKETVTGKKEYCEMLSFGHDTTYVPQIL